NMCPGKWVHINHKGLTIRLCIEVCMKNLFTLYSYLSISILSII
ncbi:hypothetical protein HMPREF3233_01361, partial [Veillonella atypica]